MVPKGSVAVDGVSLTLVDVAADRFSVALIPHTLTNTTLGFKQNGATADELAAAKLHLKGSILLSLESTISRMSAMARQEYYFGRQFTPDQIIAQIDAVKLEDIQSVAETIVDPESLSLTLLGNLKTPGFSTDMLREAVA